MKALFFAAFLIILLVGCSKDKDRSPSSIEQGTGSESSVVIVEIATVNPTVETPLIAQYSMKNSEEQQIVMKYRWYLDGTVVPGVDGYILAPSFFSKGARVEVEAVPVINGVETKSYKTQAVMIGNAKPTITSVELTPVPAFPGDKITAVAVGTDPDKNDEVTFQYEWQVDGQKIPGAESQILDTAVLHKKNIVSVTVTPFDGYDKGAPMQSPFAIVLSNRNPEITSTPSMNFKNGIYICQVTAKDAEGDPLTYALETGPQGMSIDQSSGLIRWTPPMQVLEKQEIVVKVSVDDGDGGKSFQEFSFTLGVK